jgi:uncharacterized protein YdeI (YjbR/CyaY-like superfamily)
VLQKPGDNSQAARQLRVTGMEEVRALEPVLKGYIREAIGLEKAGKKVDFKAKTELVYPAEFKQVVKSDPTLKKAFEALTPGRQRAYLMHFAAPKQVKTRESRIEKCKPLIMQGRGLNE